MGESLLDFPRSGKTFGDQDKVSRRSRKLSNRSLFDLMFLSTSS